MSPTGRSSASLDLAQVTPLVLAYNEAHNIGRCLARLSWADRVVVLDSGSTDGTQEIAGRFPNAELHHRPFDDHTAQWNFGLTLVRTPWVLSLDADYILGGVFFENLRKLPLQDDVDAVFAPFRYCIFGRPLRASLYPPRAVLFRAGRCRYEPDGHTQRLAIPGRSLAVSAAIDHDDRKPLSRWLVSQDRYARLEAEKLAALPPHTPGFKHRLRRTIVLGPVGVFVYTFIVKGAILDGWPGWYYTFQRTLAEMMVSLRVLDRRLRGMKIMLTIAIAVLAVAAAGRAISAGAGEPVTENPARREWQGTREVRRVSIVERDAGTDSAVVPCPSPSHLRFPPSARCPLPCPESAADDAACGSSESAASRSR